MADQPNPTARPTLPNTGGMPYLKLTITGSDGVKPEETLMKPLIVAIHPTLSLRISFLHVMEYVMRELKRAGLKDALKAIGLK